MTGLDEAFPVSLGLEQVAELLSCSTRTVRRMIASGELEAFRLDPSRTGSHLRVHRDSVLAVMRTRGRVALPGAAAVGASPALARAEGQSDE